MPPPELGLRLFDAEDAPLAAAAPCFGCNNISIWDADGHQLISFDAGSPPGRELLAFLRSLGPEPVPARDAGSHRAGGSAVTTAAKTSLP